MAPVYACPVPQFSTSEAILVVNLTFLVVLCVEEKKKLGVTTSTDDSLRLLWVSGAVELVSCTANLPIPEVRQQSDNDNEAIEQIDEDIAVTQSQMNFICPITQVEMKRPVRNKVCGHIYEEDAILEIIQGRKQQKKKVRCPKIGCSHADVKESDLVPDEALKRAIDSQNKQSWSTLEKSAPATKKNCYESS
ncbi:PREDICTED: E3 SUMO-protein ligase NSE2, partial [Buceros rhinoceros silvestris]|uniref:E3 SUMO-protein ligase NSE2 n=1 Tax=Buceros rhinoceros silvestris TaxID=175836 RepID=UPI0005282E97